MSNFPNYESKVLSITIQDDDVNHDILNAQLEEIGGRLFVTGEIPKNSTESDWCEGQTAAVAWDRVTDFIVFESLDEYTKGTHKSEEYHRKEDANKDGDQDLVP